MSEEMKRPTSNISGNSIKPALSKAVEFYVDNNRQAYKCIRERDEYIDYLESQLSNAKPQQALPVVPEYVDEFINGDEKELSKADRISYLLKSVQGDSYYLTEELPRDETITFEEGSKLYNWSICQHHETILKLWGGYTVEKPQLFYLKNKLTKAFLYDNGVEFGECDENCTDWEIFKTKFTQEEIDSMETGSYELVPVEDGE